MATAAEKWFNEQQRLMEAAARRTNRDDNDRHWPILVTEIHEHIVWVEAETAEDALRSAEYDTCELIGKQTRLDAWLDVAALDQWNHEKAYDEGSGGGYEGVNCAAHVEATVQWHSAIRWAELDAAIEDENRADKPVEQRKACVPCRRWREDGHEDTDRHQREVEWRARRAEFDAQVASTAVAA